MKSKNERARTPWRLIIAAIVVICAILIPFFLYGDAIEEWTESFIAGNSEHKVLIAAVLGGLLIGDIVLPVPSSLISTACGRYLGFGLGTLVSFVAMTITAILGYLLGLTASKWAQRNLSVGERATLERLHSRWGVWSLAAVRPVPVLAEASVIFAGMSGVPWRGALPLVVLANLAVSACYAAIGALARGRYATLLAFAGAALLSGLAMLLFRRRASRG